MNAASYLTLKTLSCSYPFQTCRLLDFCNKLRYMYLYTVNRCIVFMLPVEPCFILNKLAFTLGWRAVSDWSRISDLNQKFWHAIWKVNSEPRWTETAYITYAMMCLQIAPNVLWVCRFPFIKLRSDTTYASAHQIIPVVKVFSLPATPILNFTTTFPPTYTHTNTHAHTYIQTAETYWCIPMMKFTVLFLLLLKYPKRQHVNKVLYNIITVNTTHDKTWLHVTDTWLTLTSTLLAIYLHLWW